MVWLTIDRQQQTSLTRQIYEQIQLRILQGDLISGERLPSTRELASNLQISRNTVVEAYEQLSLEGFVESRRGSGTYVSSGASLKMTIHQTESLLPELGEEDEPKTDQIIDFRAGVPALDGFPRKKWAQIAQRTYLDMPDAMFGYGSPQGQYELRKAIAGHLYRNRGIRCLPEQMIITTGGAQALSLIAKLLVQPDQMIVVEDPMHQEIYSIFSSASNHIFPIPVDENGLRTELLSSIPNPDLIYLTPSHQFPVGGILPIQRRIHLIEFAQANQCYIIEDDYDSEYHYEGVPLSTLYSLDPQHVIYIGTFSKILTPALRLGYVILPLPLIKRARMIKRLLDLHTSSFEQLILARFIEAGELTKHLNRMKKRYRKLRNQLTEALTNTFGNNIHLHGSQTGLHIVAEFPVSFSDSLLDQIYQAGVRVETVNQLAVNKHLYPNHLILGYGNLTEEQIIEGVKRLSQILYTHSR